MKRAETRAVRADLEYRAAISTAALGGRPIQHVSGQQQFRGGTGPVIVGETVEHSKAQSIRANAEHRAGATAAVPRRCAIEGRTRQDERSRRISAIGIGHIRTGGIESAGGKIVQPGETGTVGIHLENRAAVGLAARSRRAIQHVARHQQTVGSAAAIVAIGESK